MSNKTTDVLCPNCKGKGHVFSGAMMAGGPFIWLLVPFERNDPNGVTRDVCSHCDGAGYLEIRR